MGTNYYIKSNECKCCGHKPEELHIGKSSAGWCFSLQIHPDIGVNSLEDWKLYWKDKHIVDEYGQDVSSEKMLGIITDRSWEGTQHLTKDMLRQNGAEIGPNNLLRHKIGDFCIGHGEGTWDYFEREFS